MQQNQQGRRFSDAPQPPVYRFPRNQPGYQPANPSYQEEAPLTRQDRRDLKRKHKRRKIFTLWNLFAVIGILTVIIQALRYLVIPMLVYLNTLTGGAL